MAHALQRIVIGDDPGSWRSAGFSVLDNEMVFGKTVVELAGTANGRGVLGWAIEGVTSNIESITSIAPSGTTLAVEQRTGLDNTNAVFAIDHVVIETGDLDRTVAAFTEVGMKERRQGQMTTPLGERRQSFLWAGRVIIEIVAPVTADPNVAMRVWGLALVSANLATTSHVLAENMSEPRDAVQPGRKIATIDTSALDISVPLVVMSPHVAELL